MGLSNPEVRFIRDLQLFADQANFVEPTWLYIRRLCLKSPFHSHQALAWCCAAEAFFRNRFNGFRAKRRANR